MLRSEPAPFDRRCNDSRRNPAAAAPIQHNHSHSTERTTAQGVASGVGMSSHGVLPASGLQRPPVVQGWQQACSARQMHV